MPFLSILNRGARSSARSASSASGAGNDAGWVAPQRGGSQTRETSEAEPAGDDAAGDAPAAAPSTAISQGAVSQASLGNIFDAELFAGWVESNAAFIVLLLLLAIAQHVYALVQLVFVATSAASSTLHLQALVATPPEGKRLKLLDVLIIVSVNVWALTLLGMPNAPIWRALLFRAPAVHYSAGQSVFYAAVTALLLKQWMVLPKVLSVLACTCAPAAWAPKAQRRQHAVLTLIEHLSIALTEAVPITIWFGYLLNAYAPPSGFAAVLAGTYVAVKAGAYVHVLHSLAIAGRIALLGRQPYGKKLSREATLEQGCQCPICQESPRDPLQLDCGHTFCDLCIAEWLEREQTCPMCRVTVRKDHIKSYGNGSTNLLPTVF